MKKLIPKAQNAPALWYSTNKDKTKGESNYYIDKNGDAVLLNGEKTTFTMPGIQEIVVTPDQNSFIDQNGNTRYAPTYDYMGIPVTDKFGYYVYNDAGTFENLNRTGVDMMNFLALLLPVPKLAPPILRGTGKVIGWGLKNLLPGTLLRKSPSWITLGLSKTFGGASKMFGGISRASSWLDNKLAKYTVSPMFKDIAAETADLAKATGRQSRILNIGAERTIPRKFGIPVEDVVNRSAFGLWATESAYDLAKNWDTNSALENSLDVLGIASPGIFKGNTRMLRYYPPIIGGEIGVMNALNDEKERQEKIKKEFMKKIGEETEEETNDPGFSIYDTYQPYHDKFYPYTKAGELEAAEQLLKNIDPTNPFSSLYPDKTGYDFTQPLTGTFNW